MQTDHIYAHWSTQYFWWKLDGMRLTIYFRGPTKKIIWTIANLKNNSTGWPDFRTYDASWVMCKLAHEEMSSWLTVDQLEYENTFIYPAADQLAGIPTKLETVRWQYEYNFHDVQKYIYLADNHG